MKSSANSLKPENVELLYRDEDKTQVEISKLSTALNKVWQFLITLFTKEPELQVRQQSDRSGNTWWTAYDPVTGHTGSFGCPQELLAWIERRYNRNSY